MVYIDYRNFNFPISREYGPNGHNGIDIAMPYGTPVYANADGIIASSGLAKLHRKGTLDGWMNTPDNSVDAGAYVLIECTDMYVGYSHLSKVIAQPGQAVMSGDLIGYSGTSGTSTGPHLHFDVIDKPQNWNNGYSARINPRKFMRKRPA